MSLDLELISTEDLTKSARIVMEEGFAQVIEVDRRKLNKHFELCFFNFFENIFVIKRAVEFRFSFTSCNSSPVIRSHHTLNETVLCATVESSQCFKLLRIV